LRAKQWRAAAALTTSLLERGRRGLLVLAALCVMALVAAPVASAGRSCEGASATPEDASTEQLTESTLCLLNAQRTRFDVRPFRMSEQLSEAALRHASDMERRHYFSHVSRNGSSFVQRIRRTGYL